MSHAYLELDARSGADANELVRLVASLREPRTTIGGVNLVAGFRPELWASVAPGTSPVQLAGFNEPIVGADGYTLPATQHESSSGWPALRTTWCLTSHWASSRRWRRTRPSLDELVGWPYHRDLDLTGFIDGTENPTLIEAAAATTVEPGAPGEGGSVLLLQQWEHDAAAWTALPIAQQEEIIGRRKLDSEELKPKPDASHVASTDQDRFGRIFRRNIGYGTLTQHGTIFVGFSRDRERLDAMLDSMAAKGGGQRDRLTDFTQAVTGAYYFVPASEALATFATGPAS